MKYNIAAFKEGFKMPFAVVDTEYDGTSLPSLAVVRELEARGDLGWMHDIQINDQGTHFFLYERGFICIGEKDRKAA